MKELLTDIESAMEMLYEMAFLDKHKNCPEYVRENANKGEKALKEIKQMESLLRASVHDRSKFIHLFNSMSSAFTNLLMEKYKRDGHDLIESLRRAQSDYSDIVIPIEYHYEQLLSKPNSNM